uniref:protein-tyrosine-phosphatase n=1 Tax=Tetraselmis sp. GSL018 TaxID=582737 RepID=A0A061R845_9CHLO
MGAQGNYSLEQDEPTLVHSNEISAVLLGDVFHVVDTGLLDRHNITHLLLVASKCSLPPGSASRQVLTVPLAENGTTDLTVAGRSEAAENTPTPTAAARLDQCLEFIEEAWGSGGRILIACSNGNNRAAVVSLAWLMRQRRWGVQDSLRHLQELRPSIRPPPQYLSQLKTLEPRLQEA